MEQVRIKEVIKIELLKWVEGYNPERNVPNPLRRNNFIKRGGVFK